jgi:hypothetical protein
MHRAAYVSIRDEIDVYTTPAVVSQVLAQPFCVHTVMLEEYHIVASQRWTLY